MCPSDGAVQEVLRCSKTHLRLKIIFTEKKECMCPIKVTQSDSNPNPNFHKPSPNPNPKTLT